MQHTIHNLTDRPRAFRPDLRSKVRQRRHPRPSLQRLLPGRGDSYHAFYLGGQYFIHGDKLKLMAGVEYAALGQNSSADRYDGYTFLTGLRLSF